LQFNFSFCTVNFGIENDTLENIRQIANKDKSVKYLSFSRNFGQQIALKVGINSIDADAIIMIDNNLQHSPNLIPKLIKVWQTQKVNMVNTIGEEDEELGWFKKK
jgi:glycosyltransferase involved in cell wall biosynthesis